MGTIDGDALSRMFRTTYRVIQRQTEGLTHADSLLQPAFRGNCLNWVVGHIVASRTTIMRLLDVEPVWSDEERARYKQGSEPITEDGGDVYPLEKILADYDESQSRLLEAFENATPEKLGELSPYDRDSTTTLGDTLAFFAFHESYHTGQTEYLRQIAGTDDQVLR